MNEINPNSLNTTNFNVNQNASGADRADEHEFKTSNVLIGKELSKSPSSTEHNGELFADVKENLDKLNEFLPLTSTNLSFEFDEQGEPPFIRVRDKGNDEVIREIPSEEFREVAKALEELADKLVSKGVFFDKTA